MVPFQHLCITTDILSTVFCISYQYKGADGNLVTSTGSAFTTHVDGVEYLITAKHVVEGVNAGDSILIMHNCNFLPVSVTAVVNCKNPEVDIVALVLNQKISHAIDIPLTMNGVVLSQEIFFLGFPLSINLYQKSASYNNGFPLAFVKKGIISYINYDDPNLVTVYYDLHNNGGFSGGPIIFQNTKLNKLCISGVVSAFRIEEYADKTTSSTWKGNSGISIGYSIDHILNAIKESYKKKT